jgi:hypothetical protein
MELFAGVAVLTGAVVAVLLALKVSIGILMFVVLPVLWIWMLVDAAFRADSDFPSGSTNEKLLWIVVMIALPLASIAYWLFVYRAGRRVSQPAT